MNCQSQTLAIALAGSPPAISEAWTASARDPRQPVRIQGIVTGDLAGADVADHLGGQEAVGRHLVGQHAQLLRERGVQRRPALGEGHHVDRDAGDAAVLEDQGRRRQQAVAGRGVAATAPGSVRRSGRRRSADSKPGGIGAARHHRCSDPFKPWATHLWAIQGVNLSRIDLNIG